MGPAFLNLAPSPLATEVGLGAEATELPSSTVSTWTSLGGPSGVALVELSKLLRVVCEDST